MQTLSLPEIMHTYTHLRRDVLSVSQLPFHIRQKDRVGDDPVDYYTTSLVRDAGIVSVA
jgi:hypothetical protein